MLLKGILQTILVTVTVHTAAGFYGYETISDCNVNLTAYTVPRMLEIRNQTVDSCWWRIQAADDNNRVVLDTLELHVLNERECQQAAVKLYNGPDSTTEPIRSWCGAEERLLLESNTGLNYLTVPTRYYTVILFKYYQEEVKSGFIQRVANGTFAYLESPGYPVFYYNYTDRKYEIMTENPDDKIEIEVADFQLAYLNVSNRIDDSLSVFQGDIPLGRYYGKYGPWIKTSNSTVSLQFKTFSHLPQNGFKLRYRTIPSNRTVPVVGLNNSGISTSDSFENLYIPDTIGSISTQIVDIYWMLYVSEGWAIRITVYYPPDKDKFCSGNLLRVYDGLEGSLPNVHCSVRGAEFQGTQTNMSIYLRYDGSFNTRDVRIRYYRTKDSYPCGRNVTSIPDTAWLFAPAYPNNYDENLDCVYHITAPEGKQVYLKTSSHDGIRIENSTFCHKDYIVFINGPSVDGDIMNKVCGHVTLSVTSNSRFLTIVFHSDSEIQGRGFNLEYRTLDQKDSCPKQVLSLKDTPYVIVSPQFPQNYPITVDCEWQLDVPHGYVVYLEVEMSTLEKSDNCKKDYVEITDSFNKRGGWNLGTWCGTHIPAPIHSSGIFMNIAFHSDNTTTGQGFKLLVSARAKSDFAVPSTHSPNVGMIVGIVIGVLVVVVIILVVVVVVCRRRRRGNSHFSYY